jgi:hypothetical protein
MRIRATFAGLAATAGLQKTILAEAGQLSAFSDDIVQCSVRVMRTHDDVEPFRVDLRITILGGEIFAVHEPREGSGGSDVGSELHRAFGSAALQLAAWRANRAHSARLRTSAGGW